MAAARYLTFAAQGRRSIDTGRQLTTATTRTRCCCCCH